ncbi:MAG: SagB family peptide dehydrogenase, partial [Nitrospira sp.]|nr:SagB family peptide dehydrogenase [Nitrospira sp.]
MEAQDRTSHPEQTTRSVSTDAVEQVIRYHERTKHHYHRYARSLGFLDWANQPDPFRRFAGAELIPLPLLAPDEDPASPPYAAIYGVVPPQPVTKRTLSRFFEFALALSAWKRAGQAEWALRSNPSSGNLHPTEGYVVVPRIEGLDLEPGLYHYAPREHGLERRAAFPADQVAALLAPFPAGSFLLGFTSVHWREAWKYGERAFRYCHHDVGHAIGTSRLAAATLGWHTVLLDGIDQQTVALLLGTDRVHDFAEAEPEHPDCLSVVWPRLVDDRPTASTETVIPCFLDTRIVRELAGAIWYGKANTLSREHAVHWDAIDEVAAASWKDVTEPRSVALPRPLAVDTTRMANEAGPSAGEIIRRRRSAVAYDGSTSISAPVFFRMLQRTMPRAERPQLERPIPWDVWPYEPVIHLLLFVHRVDGLTPGIYFLVRDERKLSFVQESMNREINWVPAP